MDRLNLTRSERLAEIERRRHLPLALDAETAREFQDGRLSKTCPSCGRSEAASFYCSWCLLPTDAEDWYTAPRAAGADAVARRARMPATPPADPPTELRHAETWPSWWGPCPHVQKAPRPVVSRTAGIKGPGAAPDPTPAPTVGFARVYPVRRRTA